MTNQIDPIDHSTPAPDSTPAGHQKDARSLINGQGPAETDTAAPANGVVPGRSSDTAAVPICKALQTNLLALVNKDLSGSDLSFALDAIAVYFKRSINHVEKLYWSLWREIQGEGGDGSVLEDLERLSTANRTDVMELIPPPLAAGFRAIWVTTKYEPLVMLAVLLTALSAALPLESEIELDRQAHFRQPLTLWLLLLMKSGELKSPLIGRLISHPWQKAVDPIVKEAHRQQLKDWRDKKDEARKENGEFDEKAPVLPLTLISGDLSTGGMDASFAAHNRWANRSMLLEVDEGAGLLQQMMNPRPGDKVSNWMLSRYDGKGSCNAFVDPGKKRHYDRCRLGLVLSCQPDRYYAIAGDGDQSGFNARLLVVEQLEVRQNFPDAYTEEQKQASEALDALLVKLYGSLAACDRLQLRLSQEAFERFQQEREQMDERKRSSLSDAERSLLNKSAGRFGRLAGAFHLLWLIAEGAGDVVELEPEGVVGLDAMERAIAFHELLLDQTVGVRLSANEQGTLLALGLRLHRKTWVRHGRSAPLSELRKSLSGKTRPPTEDILAALKPLVEKGYGSLEPIRYNGQQGWSYKALRALPGNG